MTKIRGVECGRCEDCGIPMVTQYAYCRDRLKWKRRGYGRLGGRGLCGTCYVRHRRDGTLPTRATVAITVTYTITCTECGDIGTTGKQDDAALLRNEHRATHTAPPAAAKPPLSDGEVARLRAMVGIGGAA